MNRDMKKRISLLFPILGVQTMLEKRMKYKMIILLLLLILLDIALGGIIKSPITYYSFSKYYISSFLLNMEKSFCMIDSAILLLLIYILGMIVINKNVKTYYIIIGKVIGFTALIISFSIHIIMGYNCIVQTKCKINGQSMYPTISDGEEVVLKFSKKISRSDVVILKVDMESADVSFVGEQYYIKRVIGLSGDQIQYIDNKLYLNHSLFEETYLTNASFSEMTNDFTGIFRYKENNIIIESSIIPDGYCFVMGDNRKVDMNGKNQSYDSREFGLIPISCILGIVDSKVERDVG